MDEDLRLVERYIAGDVDAVEDLVMKYQKQIYAVLYRMTGNAEDAKDLTQTAFVKAMEAMGGFRRESSFKTWFYQIAINAGLNHLKLRCRQEVELEESLTGGHTGTLTRIIEKERRVSIKEGLDELPARQRLAVILRAYEGLSCTETARIMGCTEGAVKAHYHHAVKKLREILRKRGYEIRP